MSTILTGKKEIGILNPVITYDFENQLCVVANSVKNIRIHE